MPPRRQKKRRYLRWTKEEIRTLRRHSRLKTPVRELARLLRNRREQTIRQVAYNLGLSLGQRNSPTRKRAAR